MFRDNKYLTMNTNKHSNIKVPNERKVKQKKQVKMKGLYLQTIFLPFISLLKTNGLGFSHKTL